MKIIQLTGAGKRYVSLLFQYIIVALSSFHFTQ